MIDLASFYTNPISTGSIAESGKEGGTPKQGGFGIFDLLLNQLQQQIANAEDGEGESDDTLKTVTKHEPLDSDNPALSDDSKLALLRALASNEAVADDVTQLDEIAELDLIAEIEQTLALNQRIFDNKIEAGTGNDDLLIDKETGEIIVPNVAKALNLLESGEQLFSGDINDIIDNIDLNTINLTPAQLTLLDDIQKGVVPTEAQANDVVGVLNILQNGLVALVATQGGIGQPRTPSAGASAPGLSGAHPSQGLPQAAANGLENAALRTNAQPANGTPLPFAVNDAIDEGDANFEQVLKNAIGKKSDGQSVSPNDLASQSNAANNSNANAPSQAAFNILQAWPFASSGSLYGSAGFSDSVAEQLGLSLNGGQSTAQGSLSALVNQAQAASQPHPATQMVAASITKGAQKGADTNISLRLDPPGLGRVEVEMTFTKSKTMKAVVIAEKPETFMMLQRDAQVLERALQGAGLDTDSGLSFELAQDGEFFDRHNQRGGGHEQGGTGRGGDGEGEDLEIIESTMTWRVDPETGHTRYDIYA